MNKKNLILGGVLVFLVLLAYFFQGPVKNWQEKNAKPDNFLANLKLAETNKIEIVKGNSEAVFIERKDDRWLMSNTKAFFVKDDIVNKIENVIKEANELDLELISKNADKKGEFDVDAEKGLKIKMTKDENVLAYFVVGKMTTDFKGVYLAEPDNDETYIIKANLRNVFDRNDWYDKSIFDNDKEKISKIRFQYQDEGFTAEKNDEGWVGLIPYKFPIDDEKMNKIADIMAGLSASKIPVQSFDGTGLEKNLIIVQATGDDGFDNTIMIGDSNAEDDELFYAKSARNDNIYLISKENKDFLDVRIRDLK